jgi:DNA mismatch repair protein MutL
MGKIKQLPPHEIRKIAAGEVVERPANIIKELVENSLDAGATAITIIAEQGGKSLLRVIDNGYGMSLEDAHICIAHHATSKISSVSDLENLTTFGFRGEALSSIASVSRVTLITKESTTLEGNKLTIEEGRVVAHELTACTTGTDITVADLFYNMPARRKFLKTDETEWRAIYQLVQACALSHQE